MSPTILPLWTEPAAQPGLDCPGLTSLPSPLLWAGLQPNQQREPEETGGVAVLPVGQHCLVRLQTGRPDHIVPFVYQRSIFLDSDPRLAPWALAS